MLSLRVYLRRQVYLSAPKRHFHFSTTTMTQISPQATPKFGSEVLESYVLKGGVKVAERFFHLPLDYKDPEGEKIRVFARSMIPTDKAKTPEEQDKLPILVYLQGGPGHEVPLSDISGYTGEIHEKGYQTLWLDQRGTGLSTPFSADIIPSRLKTDQDIADYLKHFRADNIVNDCEAIRKALLGHKTNPEEQKWTILGQSFGGFCAITYLSFHSAGLKEVFTTGGLAPLVSQPDTVYQHTVRRVITRNEVYYKKYPQDVKRVRDIMAYLDGNEVLSSNGGRLSPQRFQQLGMDFGMNNGIDRVHQLVFHAVNDLELFGRFSNKTINLIESAQGFDTNPLFAVLHEPIYCQGAAARWSAARTIEQHPQFHWSQVKLLADSEPVYFTGEMIFPSMFDDYATLRPLKGAAEILAAYDGWGPLWDTEQLAKNTVNVSAVQYVDDMYVDFDLSQETAKSIKNTEQYITNQLVHSGLREAPKDVMGRLFQLSKREYD